VADPTELTPDERRELSRAAKQIVSFTARRNAMIRDLHERGRGLRAIAKAAGLSPSTVHTMLHGRKR
jgi:lambda repressor-like predicted transcriptional regulator